MSVGSMVIHSLIIVLANDIHVVYISGTHHYKGQVVDTRVVG